VLRLVTNMGLREFSSFLPRWLVPYPSLRGTEPVLGMPRRESTRGGDFGGRSQGGRGGRLGGESSAFWAVSSWAPRPLDLDDL
jgi:hypothetical protein